MKKGKALGFRLKIKLLKTKVPFGRRWDSSNGERSSTLLWKCFIKSLMCCQYSFLPTLLEENLKHLGLSGCVES